MLFEPARVVGVSVKGREDNVHQFVRELLLAKGNTIQKSNPKPKTFGKGAWVLKRLKFSINWDRASSVKGAGGKTTPCVKLIGL